MRCTWKYIDKQNSGNHSLSIQYMKKENIHIAALAAAAAIINFLSIYCVRRCYWVIVDGLINYMYLCVCVLYSDLVSLVSENEKKNVDCTGFQMMWRIMSSVDFLLCNFFSGLKFSHSTSFHLICYIWHFTNDKCVVCTANI